MRSHRTGSLSATTKVKVFSPEITLIAMGQGFHILETKIGTHIKGECVSGVPGSKSVAGKRTVYNGTWENQIVFKRSSYEIEEMTKEYVDLVVGLTHSRGVNRVMPVEFQVETLEGVSSLTKRGSSCYAILRY